MIARFSLAVLLLIPSALLSQNFSVPTGGASGGFLAPLSHAMDINNLWGITGTTQSPLDTKDGSISKLDIKAPGKARHEYDKGYQLLMRKDLVNAIAHLSAAISTYPSFVAAHNALGTAYLDQGQNDQARREFSEAVALDDHLPTSFFNLGCAELASQHFPAAVQSIQKASDIAPLDLTLLTALAYSQLMNHDYDAAVATANKVHERKHNEAAIVHVYAAAALSAQNKLPQAQNELIKLLREDPKSPAAGFAVQMISDLKEAQSQPAMARDAGLKVTITDVPGQPTGPSQLPARIRQLLADARENGQIAEAEADAEGNCDPCAPEPLSASRGGTSGTAPDSGVSRFSKKNSGFIFRSSSDEVAVLFAATDHGKSVIDLTRSDVSVNDDHKAPFAITGFRNQSQLPLRIGLVIDTSESIAGRFKFEQEAAENFIQKVLTGETDRAFVVGFSNSVLLEQDFTGDKGLISHAVGQLVPAGGTALWDAVAYAADKLSDRQENVPVAKALVVISDGDDNSSSMTLAQAIKQAQRGEVTVYTVSTREALDNLTFNPDSSVGEHALATLSDLTGGAAFAPGSIHRLKASLNDLQQVIRSRYLISYKPALFKRDGQYRTIDIKAEKNGHKLRVYARKGYYASTAKAADNHN
ncbi:MAG TPA: VWA domain-containing protein [Candidatus Binatia bacterium]|nr:VWA domain-containing protein [Candidatus Binatia bacterium]